MFLSPQLKVAIQQLIPENLLRASPCSRHGGRGGGEYTGLNLVEI